MATISSPELPPLLDGEVAAGLEVDVLVVGAGLAGLCAAASAARSGASVLVAERSSAVGGRSATRDEDGFLFNAGPHALYVGCAADRVLAELGVGYSGRRPAPSGGLAVHGRRLHALPGGFVSLLSTGLLTVSGKVELARLMGAIPSMDPERLRGLTLARWLDGTVRDATVRQLVEALMRLTSYASEPGLCCAAASLAQLQAGLSKGVVYVDGGWQSLVDGLARAAGQAGCRLLSGHRTVSVHATGDAVDVELRRSRSASGSTPAHGDDVVSVRAGSVVLAVPPAAAAAVVEGAGSSTLRDWADAATPVHAACLDLGLARLPEPRRLFALGIDEPTYFSVHSASARLAPGGAALVHVARYLGAERGDPKEVERGLEALCDLVQPGWRKEVRHRRFLPSMTVTPALVEAGKARPGPAVPGCDRLMVAGDWVGDEGMLADTALASGRKAGVEAAARALAWRRDRAAASRAA